MSDQVLIALIGGLSIILVALQNNRMTAQRLAFDKQIKAHDDASAAQQSIITQQGQEQERQAATLTRIKAEADKQDADRRAQREEDREEARRQRQEYKEAADYYKEQWAAEVAITRAQRVEIAGLTQQVIDSIKANDALQREFAASDQAHALDVEKLKTQAVELDNLRLRVDGLQEMLRKSEKTVENQQGLFDSLIKRFDADLQGVTATYATTVDALRQRIGALETERIELKAELTQLRNEFKALSAPPIIPQAA